MNCFIYIELKKFTILTSIIFRAQKNAKTLYIKSYLFDKIRKFPLRYGKPHSLPLGQSNHNISKIKQEYSYTEKQKHEVAR